MGATSEGSQLAPALGFWVPEAPLPRAGSLEEWSRGTASRLGGAGITQRAEGLGILFWLPVSARM